MQMADKFRAYGKDYDCPIYINDRSGYVRMWELILSAKESTVDEMINKRRVVELLKSGLSNQEIASQVGCSLDYVKKVLSEVYKDVGLTHEGRDKRLQLVMLLTLPLNSDIVRSIVIDNLEAHDYLSIT